MTKLKKRSPVATSYCVPTEKPPRMVLKERKRSRQVTVPEAGQRVRQQIP